MEVQKELIQKLNYVALFVNVLNISLNQYLLL